MKIELHVPDFEPARLFYKKLGFDIVWERAHEGRASYLVMKREDNILCFWCGGHEIYDHSYFKNFPRNTPPGYGVEIILQIQDPESLYKTMKDDVSVVSPYQQKPWGLYDFRVKDPYGFYLRITSIHDITIMKDAIAR